MIKKKKKKKRKKGGKAVELCWWRRQTTDCCKKRGDICCDWLEQGGREADGQTGQHVSEEILSGQSGHPWWTWSWQNRSVNMCVCARVLREAVMHVLRMCWNVIVLRCCLCVCVCVCVFWEGGVMHVLSISTCWNVIVLRCWTCALKCEFSSTLVLFS